MYVSVYLESKRGKNTLSSARKLSSRKGPEEKGGNLVICDNDFIECYQNRKQEGQFLLLHAAVGNCNCFCLVVCEKILKFLKRVFGEDL